MTTRIIGLDVCRSSVAAWPLESVPDSPKRYFRDNKDECELLQATTEGISRLKELRPDWIALEPTGLHYSRIWAKAAKEIGAGILWVGHSQLKSTRHSLLLPNKNDPADALALAIYSHTHLGDSDYFLDLDPFCPAAGIRELALQLSHLARVQSPVINRLRQNLAHEWPEKANIKIKRVHGDPNPPGILRWIAGEQVAAASGTRFSNSLQNSCGSGLSGFTRAHAGHLVSIHRQEIEIERLIDQAMSDPALDPYHQVFNQFGMGRRIRGMLLGHCYPITTFLAPDGSPIKEWVKTAGGKKSCRHRSLNSFKLRLGLGLVEDSSGQTSRNVPGGSSLCRKALWQWIFTTIEPVKNRPPNTVGRDLGEYLDRLKADGIPVQLARSRVSVRAVERLFYELASRAV